MQRIEENTYSTFSVQSLVLCKGIQPRNHFHIVSRYIHTAKGFILGYRGQTSFTIFKGRKNHYFHK